MIEVYGSSMCPDCIEMKKAFDIEGIEYVYHDITADLKELKAFLALRDSSNKFRVARERGLIGIPIVKEDDGEWTFHWQDFVKSAGAGSVCEDGVCGIHK